MQSQCRRINGECLPQAKPAAILGSGVNQMADYRIEPDGLVIQYVSEKSTLRTSPPGRVKIGARLAFKTQHDTRQFVVAGEREGFVFEGKEFLVD